MKADFWDKYSNHILIGISVVCLGLAAWIYWSRQTRNAETQAWGEMAEAQETAHFTTIADEPRYAGTSAAPWASLRAAELYLQDGAGKMFTDREGAAADLDQARSRLESLLKSSTTSEIRERALYTLAQTLETQNQLDEAAKRYEELLKEFPNTSLKSAAEGRLEAIKSGEAKNFYAWFAKQKPKPVEPPKPKDDTSSILPDMPNLDFKDIPFPDSTSTKPEKTTEEKSRSTETPKLPDLPALPESKDEPKADANDKPAPETKPEDKPAAETKPDEKPATETKPNE
jgi:hypothetical protein